MQFKNEPDNFFFNFKDKDNLSKPFQFIKFFLAKHD